MAALVRIHQLARNGSQLIIATHSPVLMVCPNALLLHPSEDGIKPGHYKDTEHYALSKRFFDNPQRVVAELLRQERRE